MADVWSDEILKLFETSCEKHKWKGRNRIHLKGTSILTVNGRLYPGSKYSCSIWPAQFWKYSCGCKCFECCEHTPNATKTTDDFLLYISVEEMLELVEDESLQAELLFHLDELIGE